MKIRFAVLLIALVMILGSCGQPAAQNAAPVKGTFGEQDLVFALNGTQYLLKTDVAPLLKALGEDYELTEAISCVYKGNDKTFCYADIEIDTNPIDGKDVFYEIDITGGDFQTSKGIKIGSTLDEVKAAYGGGGVEADSSYTYYLSGNKEDLTSPQLYFALDESGKVTMISYYYPTNIK